MTKSNFVDNIVIALSICKCLTVKRRFFAAMNLESLTTTKIIIFVITTQSCTHTHMHNMVTHQYMIPAPATKKNNQSHQTKIFKFQYQQFKHKNRHSEQILFTSIFFLHNNRRTKNNSLTSCRLINNCKMEN